MDNKLLQNSNKVPWGRFLLDYVKNLMVPCLFDF